MNNPTSRTPAQPMIEVDHVSKSFGTRPALIDVSLTLETGEVVVLIGPSGAGKSTLCRVINRIEPFSHGEIRIAGEVVPRGGPELARIRTKTGMVFQSINLFAHLSILRNLTIGPETVLGIKPVEARERAMHLLGRVGIAEQAHKMPAQLSGGQQQRAGIARALAMQPLALLFDEPTSALDPESTREVLKVMTDLAGEGTTMLVVTHEMGFARECADRVAFMADGRMVEIAPARQFFDNPREERARQFLAQVSSAKPGLTRPPAAGEA
jgi:glutamate transport system ATP-binding protein